MIWQLHYIGMYYHAELNAALQEGWEPFGVSSEGLILLRRQVEREGVPA